MADETRNAEVRLTAQVDPYVSSVQQASEETAKFSAVVDQLTNKFDKLQKVAGKKLVIFGAGVGVGVVGVTKQAADLEKRMSTLHATAAVTTKTTAGFEKEINKLGKQLPITNKAAIELVTTLDKLGVNSTRRIGDISREMVKLSEATGESLGGLTNGMVGLGRQMGTLAAGDMSTFANSLLRVSKSAGVSAEGVLSFSQAIAGSARAAGMTEQQVLGIGAAFQRAGADGFAAANTFNQMLNDIQRQIATGSPEIAKYANLIGVTSEQFAKMDKGEALIQIFEQINKQGPDAIKVMDQLGFDGVRAVREIQKVSQAGGMRQAVMMATGSTDKLDQASAAAMGGLSDSLTKTGNALERLAQIAGGPFVQAFTPVIDIFNKALNVVNALATPLASVGAKMTALIGTGAGVLGGVLLLSRLRSLVTMAGFVANSGPVEAARGGFAVGRGIATGRPVVNEASRRFAAGELRWWQRPAFLAAQGAGQAMGPGGGRSMVGPLLTSPLRAATWLANANTEFITNARTSGFNRSAPILGALGDRSTQFMAAARHPLDFARGFSTTPFQAPKLDEAGQRLADRARQFVARGDAVPERLAARLAEAQLAAAKAVAANSAATAANTKAKGAEVNAARQLAAATGGLTKAFIRMEAQSLGTTVAIGGKAAFGAGKALAGGALGLVGGPWGAAAIGGIMLGSSLISRAKERNESTIDGAAGVDPYRVALGFATEELGTFAGALKEATRNLPKPRDFSDLRTISDEVVNVAKTPDRKLVNPDVKNFDSAKGIAAFLSSTNFQTPEELQLAQADLVQATGDRKKVQDAMDLFFKNGGPGGGVDFGGLIGEVQAKQGAGGFRNTLRAPLGLGGSDESIKMVGGIFDDIQQRQGRNATQFNSQFAKAEQFNEMLGVLAAATTKKSENNFTGKSDQDTLTRVVKEFEQRMLPEGTDLDFYAATMAKDMEAAGVDLSDTGAKMAFWAKYINEKVPDTDNPNTVATVEQLEAMKKSSESALNRRMRGAGAAGAAFLDDTTVKDAINRSGDVNAQYQGTLRLLEVAGKSADGVGKTFAEIDAALQAAKAANRDPSSAEWALLSNAQQMNEVRRQGAMPMMSREQRLGQASQRFNAVMDSDHNAPDFEIRRQGAEAEMIGARQQQYDFMKSLVEAHKNFAIQVKRMEEARQLTLERGEADFQRQMLQGEQDFLRQRTNAQDDFTRSLERSAKDQAKAIYDPMRRMYAEYTTDAGTLMQNLEDQNRRIAEQSANLAKAASLGLSKQAIESLNLADVSQAQNLARIVDDLASDPSMVQGINDKITERLANTTDLVQSQYNEAFARQQEDWDRSRAREEEQYDLMVQRSNEAHQLSLDRMGEDFGIQLQQSKEDLARMGEEVFGSFSDVMTQATDLIKSNLGVLGDTTIAELNRVAANIPQFTTGDFSQSSNVAKFGTQYGGGTSNNLSGAGHIRYFAAGGIATKATSGVFGEHGAEALLPLNSHGTGFLAGMYQEITRQLVRELGTVASPVAYNGGASHIDASTNFTGPVTVQAQDPNEMARALKEKARVQKLTRPTLSAQ